MLELKNIVKSFGGNVILDDISLNIEEGEIVSILGPSGSGKTTLLNLILGITDIDKGSLVYNGRDLTRVPMEQERIQYCVPGLCTVSEFKCISEYHLWSEK